MLKVAGVALGSVSPAAWMPPTDDSGLGDSALNFLEIAPVGSGDSFFSSLHGSTPKGTVIAAAGGLPTAFQGHFSSVFPSPWGLAFGHPGCS